MHFRNFSIALVAGSLFVLSGCEPTSTSAPTSTSSNRAQLASTATVQRGKTAEERKLEQQVRNLNQVTRNIVVSNTVQGALAGAALGCLLGQLVNENCGRGALAGGVAGGVAGNQVGQQAAQAKRELVQADQTIAKLKGVNKRLGAVEANLRSVLSRQNSEIASLRRQLQAGQVSKSAYDARISAINSNRRAVIEGLGASEQNVARERAQLVSAEQESGESLSSTKAAVESTRNRISSLRRSVDLISS